MSRTYELTELKIGDVVHDMHDGWPDFQKLFNLKYPPEVSQVCLAVPDGHLIIQQIMKNQYAHRPDQMTERMRATKGNAAYTNKFLVYIGGELNGRFQFAYSYDGNRLGFVSISVD